MPSAPARRAAELVLVKPKPCHPKNGNTIPTVRSTLQQTPEHATPTYPTIAGGEAAGRILNLCCEYIFERRKAGRTCKLRAVVGAQYYYQSNVGAFEDQNECGTGGSRLHPRIRLWGVRFSKFGQDAKERDSGRRCRPATRSQ